jgi:hypothetical protein
VYNTYRPTVYICKANICLLILNLKVERKEKGTIKESRKVWVSDKRYSKLIRGEGMFVT